MGVNSLQEVAKSLVEVTSIDELSDVIIYDPDIVSRLKRESAHDIIRHGGMMAGSIAKILYTVPKINKDIYRYRVTKSENIKIIKEGDGVWRAKIIFDECVDEDTAMQRKLCQREKIRNNTVSDYFGNEISVGSRVVFIKRKIDGRNASANLAEGVVTGINSRFGQVYVDGYVVGFRSKNVIVFPEESKENPCI